MRPTMVIAVLAVCCLVTPPMAHGMSKNDLIAAVAERSGLSEVDSAKAVEGVFDAITETLKNGEAVYLADFGTFRIRKRAARSYRNLDTGDLIMRPASAAVTFSAGKVLKDAFNPLNETGSD